MGESADTCRNTRRLRTDWEALRSSPEGYRVSPCLYQSSPEQAQSSSWRLWKREVKSIKSESAVHESGFQNQYRSKHIWPITEHAKKFTKLANQKWKHELATGEKRGKTRASRVTRSLLIGWKSIKFALIGSKHFFIHCRKLLSVFALVLRFLSSVTVSISGMRTNLE